MINLLEMGRMTSGYGKRSSPTAGASSNHKGVDIVLNDKNVPAVMGGEVVATGYSRTAGNYVQVQQQDGTLAKYFHLASQNVAKGDKVSEGQKIGVMGSTGVSTGPHLHFQVEKDGSVLDPIAYLQKGEKWSGTATEGDTSSTSSGSWTDKVADTASDIGAKLIQVLAVVLVAVVAVLLFLKAFDIKVL